MAKISAPKLWKQVRTQPVVVVAVVVMLIAALATVMHAYSMRRAVGKAQETFMREEMAVERFDATVSDPAAGVVQRKLRPYVEAGMTQFFSSGSAADRELTVSQRQMFFQPTNDDVSCDFTVVSNVDCTPLIERLTCTDRTTAFPGDRTVLQASELSSTVASPTNSSDCNVYVMDGIYLFSKTALNAYAAAWVPPNQPERGPCYLVMPRSDITTMLVMLLRPSFVRGTNSMLYYVDYNEVTPIGGQAPDGMAYTSWDTKATASLRLIPVNNASIDGPDMGTLALPKLLPPANTVTAPLTLADVVPPSGSALQPLVLYYLKYKGPNTAVGSMPIGAATLYCRIGAVVSATASDGVGATLLSANRKATDTDITLAVKGATSGGALLIPAVDTGVLVVTLVGNVLVAATFGPTRCAIRRWNLSSNWLSYKSSAAQSQPGSGCTDRDIVQTLGLYSATCVPCLADVALRTARLASSLYAGTSDVEDALTVVFGDTLHGTDPMLPGRSLTSLDGKYKATFQADCNLVVWDTHSGMPAWNSMTRMTNGAIPGKLEIDPISGIVSMTTSGGTVYWRTMRSAGRPDLGRFKLVLENDGVLRVRSSYGNVVSWQGVPGENGVPFLLSCVDAAAAYAAKHMQEPSYSKASGPWNHFVTFGQTAGYDWPGPGGPCDESGLGGKPPVIKTGNNGTMSCSDYCVSPAGGGSKGTCVGALDSGTGAILNCSQVRGQGRDEVTCQCSG